MEFLDVLLENNNGQLRTSVFHKPAAEPYILPYLSDHPHHIHRSTIKGRLLRTARVSSHVAEFDKERLNIEFTLLLNGHPPRFISYHLKQFFEKNNAMSLTERLDEVVYEELHRTLLVQLSPCPKMIVDKKKYSIHNKVEAFSEKYKIDIEYKARVSNENPGGRGLGLKVLEQISHYQVVLYGKQGQD